MFSNILKVSALDRPAVWWYEAYPTTISLLPIEVLQLKPPTLVRCGRGAANAYIIIAIATSAADGLTCVRVWSIEDTHRVRPPSLLYRTSVRHPFDRLYEKKIYRQREIE
ncbi:hypothetical protein EVAR_55450_1 [Eumeta japonica]|uniref:Uncharacterized protein n=1 Tax=Eumeta variegata TaxID=151549 RepID=A0A4C1Y3N3_EUMVA|nr:hypothetical protein EVAR_55450_1 [Eumeta japonica]